jgi:hypothetical protein
MNGKVRVIVPATRPVPDKYKKKSKHPWKSVPYKKERPKMTEKQAKYLTDQRIALHLRTIFPMEPNE